jgi:cysteine desulfuration protein SufE
MLPTIHEITENFALLDDWEDRYRYVIELGRRMPPLPEADRTEDNRVLGCASRVWLRSGIDRAGPEARLELAADSDADIVRGLLAIILALYAGRTPREALAADAVGLFNELDLGANITSQRSNGVRSVVERIRRDAVRLEAAG